jgi:hypothetical protein
MSSVQGSCRVEHHHVGSGCTLVCLLHHHVKRHWKFSVPKPKEAPPHSRPHVGRGVEVLQASRHIRWSQAARVCSHNTKGSWLTILIRAEEHPALPLPPAPALAQQGPAAQVELAADWCEPRTHPALPPGDVMQHTDPDPEVVWSLPTQSHIQAEPLLSPVLCSFNMPGSLQKVLTSWLPPAVSDYLKPEVLRGHTSSLASCCCCRRRSKQH